MITLPELIAILKETMTFEKYSFTRCRLSLAIVVQWCIGCRVSELATIKLKHIKTLISSPKPEFRIYDLKTGIRDILI